MRVWRGDLVDIYSKDGKSAVFLNDQVVVLSELATVVLEATPLLGDIELDELAAAVLKVIEPPPPPIDATEIISRQVHDLVAHQVLCADHEATDHELTPSAVNALRSALRHLVSDEGTTWLLPPGVSGDGLLAAGQRHRVTPTLAQGLPRLSLPAPTAAQIAAVRQQESASVEVLAADLSRAIHALQADGIRCLAFKGLALAVQAHGDAAARGTGDHDLLVRPQDLVRAHRRLVDSGWSRPGLHPVPGTSWAWRHFVQHGNEMTLESSTSIIDLHWHLNPARSAFPSFDELWARSVRVTVAGDQIPTLAPFDALAHSASHAAKDGWRFLRGLLDIHMLSRLQAVWVTADRPLRHDQLLSLGIAALIFGAPPTAPRVVGDAQEIALAMMNEVVQAQSDGSARHQATFPGERFFRVLRRLRWAGVDRADVVSLLSHSAMPPWLTNNEPSPFAAVAVPRILAHRAYDLAVRSKAEFAGQ